MAALKEMLAPVTIHGLENLVDADDDAMKLLRATLQRLAPFQHVQSIALYCDARNSEGWLEFVAKITFTEGGRPFVLGCIQRTVGGEFEFHS